ncbi:hypothetical protein TSOC_009894 [Tetrabaena socialis]|uniref:Uncharacterized protein n=1 Tax=Tetrabaena socialis TaxID=47790 RepID=A0A2J7ZUQ6_9CHLO|nr:hypothetical protein TSOC_009894 [Tetrabaena socialis]|eukprot:PNH04001.1 hypothetical protein TSOC_009894 [Tetrabaena socialis]
MSFARRRPSQSDAGGKDGPGGEGFGNEIERLLMDRPATRQAPGAGPGGGGASNTLDDLMAELGMLRNERGEMETRENQLMSLIAQLQQQVSTLSRAQQATQQQLVFVSSGGVASGGSRQPSPQRPAAAPPPAIQVSDEDFIQEDYSSSEEGTAKTRQRQQPQQRQQAAAGPPMPAPPVVGAPGGGRPNKLLPTTTPAAEWEGDVSHLRKELGALAANVVRLRDQVTTLVPGGTSLLAEEVAGQAASAAHLKYNLTQIAMDVVSLHKSLTPNGAGLAASGAGSLEESLRSAFARPTVRALPTFNSADLGFMPDNSGAAAAVAAFGGGGGGGRKEQPPANAAGGLGAAWALLNSYEEQAAVEKEEQTKAAVIARQAMGVVDAKVKQVITHVDRHMQVITADVEERLRMYEQTIIRMAQQIDRVQRFLREIEGSALSRIVVRRGDKELEGEDESHHRKDPEIIAEPAADAGDKAKPKENWVKVAAMASGRFVPQKEDEKKTARANHGYFRNPA